MNSQNYYDLLGISYDIEEEKIAAAVDQAYNEKRGELETLKIKGEISTSEYEKRLKDLKDARTTLKDDKKRAEYDSQIFEEEREPGKVSTFLKKTGTKVAVGAVVVSLLAGGFIGYHLGKTNAKVTGLDKPVTTIEQEYNKDSQKETQQETQEQTQQETQEQTQREAVEYGDIYDEALVQKRAADLVTQLNAANIINPTTGVAYTENEIISLIQYANGVYVPETMEEIDHLHLNLLNLLISPLNTEPYLYHVVYASGNDDFKDIAIEEAKNIKTVDFAEAFAEYGQNGVYPLTQWMQQKRDEIYSTTDRDKINEIYIEVGQVMADIMKGNGCTITVYEDKQEYTYTFTSEQILANHASAMLLTIDAQLIFANHYEIRDENDKVIESVQTQWEVNNKYNSENPDIVTLEEIEAWINNGCDYEWAIDDVLINGQTFGQRIQGNMEGMAQNNLAMNSGSLKK